MNLYEKRSLIEAGPDRVQAWHARPGTFRRLVPPWERVKLVERRGGLGDGGVTVLRVGRLGVRWVARHHDLPDGRGFQDVQVAGPFARWVHVHRFLPAGTGAGAGSEPGECILEDRIEYDLPLGPLGRMLLGAYVRRRISRMFGWRHRTTARDLELHGRYSGDRPLTVLVTGASGFIGSALVALLDGGGHRVIRLVRRLPSGPDEVRWDPGAGEIDRSALEAAGRIDAAVHLAAESLWGGWWTRRRRARIRDSRTEGTRLLARSLAGLPEPPEVLACASAVGYYGDQGEERLTESSPSGDGFLADVCRQWEAAADPARAAGIRVVHLRLGIVLDPSGGALRLLLPAFRLGLGARVGHGHQLMSWITRDDAIAAFLHVLFESELEGPVNACSPGPVRHTIFTRLLARVVGRPLWLAVPAPLVRAALGSMGEETVLSSACVLPVRLRETGFRFADPQLGAALRRLLGQLRPVTVVRRIAHPRPRR